MSNSNGIGADRRLRIAGLVLLGIAVIAVLIGVVVVTTRGEQPPAAAPSEPAVTPIPDSRPSTIPYPPIATSSPAAAPIVAPDAGQGAPVSDKGSSDQGRSRGEVRVYNNSTISGLAARAADDLTAAGWTVIEVGNYAAGTIPTTTVYYQTVDYQDQRDDAETIGSAFGIRVEPRFAGIANTSPGLIVIVTNDYASP